MPRTTIDLDGTLYRTARKVAIDHEKTFKQVVQEALQQYVVRQGIAAPSPRRDPMPGVYHAKVRGTVSRREIYEDLDDRFPARHGPA